MTNHHMTNYIRWEANGREDPARYLGNQTPVGCHLYWIIFLTVQLSHRQINKDTGSLEEEKVHSNEAHSRLQNSPEKYHCVKANLEVVTISNIVFVRTV